MIKFVLSAPTLSLNALLRTHWAFRKTHQRKIAREIAWQTMRVRLFDPAHVTITRYSVGTLDEDNLVGGCKPLVDVLKPASGKNPHGLGLIGDDTPDRLKLVVRQVKCRRVEQRTEVEIAAA